MYFGKHLTSTIAVCLLILISFCSSLAQDSTPPVFTVLPKNDSIFCQNANPQGRLQTWYNDFAGARATDNSGTATIEANKSLEQVRSEFNQLFNLRCDKNRRVFVKFVAKDNAGNVSDTITVYFKINDEVPIIIKQPDFIISFKSCVNGIQDSLKNWIKNYGNAQVINGCGGAVFWESFIYNSSLGEQGSGNFVNGPFPVIPANACDWSMDISFFVKDSCGNNKTLTGRYRVTDNVAPIIDDTIADITVSCFTIPDTIVKFKDFCDPNPLIVFKENIVRVGDSLSCLFYNYVINRTWTASDKCGNSTSVSQRITVIDQAPPIIDAPNELTISCLQKDSIQITLKSITDQCAKFTWSFKDSISGDSCKKIVTRVYSAVDVCGNSASKVQKLTVTDTLKPVLIKLPDSLIIFHVDSVQTVNLVNNWLSSLGGMKMVDQCNGIDTAILFTGSYDSKVITTYKGKRPTIKDFTFCKSSVDTLVDQKIDFIIIDACGNYNYSTSRIIILDTLPPTLVDCKKDYGTVVTSADCKHEILIEAPTGVDNNPFGKNLITQLVIDDSLSFGNYTQQNLFLKLKGGAHILTFSATDCSGNKSECKSNIFVLDSINPSYRLNLCTQDTLFLKSNLSDNIPTNQLKITWYKGVDSIGTGKNLTLGGASAFLASKYSLVVADSVCTLVKEIDVQVETQIKPILEVDTLQVCRGDSIKFTVEDFGGEATYYWFGNTGSGWSMVDSTNLPERYFELITDTLLVYIQVKSNVCISVPSDTLFVVASTISKPDVEPQISGNICQGGRVTLTVTNPQPDITYFWNGPNGFSKQGASIIVKDSILASDSGLYTVYGSRKGCFSDTSKTTLTILPLPVITGIIGSSSSCDGSDGIIKISTTGVIDSVRWLKNGQYLKSTSSDSLVLTNNGSDIQGLYAGIIYRNGCFSDTSSTFEFKNSGSLLVTIVKKGGTCEGDSMRLEANEIVGGSYQWQGPDGLAGSGRLFTVASRSGLYTLSVSNGQGCSVKIDTLINIPVRPVIQSLSSDYSPCVDTLKSFKLSATVQPQSNDLKYLWIGPASFRSTLQSPTVNITDGKEFGRYFLQVSLGNCIGFIDTIEIKKEVGTGKPVILGPETACLGDSILFKVKSGYNTYTWETPGGSIMLNDTILSIKGVQEKDAGVYVVKGSSGTCASESSDTFTLSIVTKPETPEIIGMDSICYGDSLRLNIKEPQPGFSYSWLFPTGETKISNPLSIIDLPDKLRGNYTVVAINGSCKSNTSLPYNVIIKAEILAPTFDVDRISLCDVGNNDVRFCLATIPVDRSLDYVIKTVPGNQILYQGKDSCYQFNTANIQAPVSRIRVQSKKDLCLSDGFDDININFAKKPDLEANIIASSASLCSSKDTIFLTNISNPDSVLYFWRVFDNGIVLQNLPGNVLQLNNFTQPTNRVILSLTYDICNNFSRDTIDIIQASKPEASNDTLMLEANEIREFPFTLNIPTNTEISFFENIDGEITQTLTGYEVNITSSNSKAVTFKYELCVEMCASFCDTGSITFIIKDSEDIECKIPNVITPNNDGVNDALIIDCAATLPDNELKIFNQWGDNVFTEAPYQNDWKAEFKGSPLPAGTYFYSFSDGKGEVFSGFIIVQR